MAYALAARGLHTVKKMMKNVATELLQCAAYGLSTDNLTFRFCNL